MSDQDLLNKIAMRFCGIHEDDMNLTERQVANLLIDGDYLRLDKAGEVYARHNMTFDNCIKGKRIPQKRD